MAPVCNQKGGWGYIDKTGKIIIGCRYNFASTFTDGLGKVMQGEKWYTIDKKRKA